MSSNAVAIGALPARAKFARPSWLVAGSMLIPALVAAPVVSVGSNVLLGGTGDTWSHLASTVLPEGEGKKDIFAAGFNPNILMHRLIILLPVLLGLLSSCNPPVRLIPGNVKTGLDSVEYAGVVENARDVDLRSAKLLAKVKVGDLGVSLDCAYPDVLERGLDKARSIGGNLLLLTEHKRNEVKSNCHTIKGEIYTYPGLEGVESQNRWHPKRPLLPGDLRGRAPKSKSAALPPVHCSISCRVGGDYFKEAITAAAEHARATGLAPMFAVTLLRGHNEGEADADALARLVLEFTENAGARPRLTLIAYNPITAEDDPFARTDEADEARFRDRLAARGVFTHRRYSGGGDVAAACGQLAARG